MASLLNDLQNVAKALLDDFGALGSFVEVQGVDSVTGIVDGTTPTAYNVQYYKDEDYSKGYLTANISGDDAMLVFYFFEQSSIPPYLIDTTSRPYPTKDWSFVDITGIEWNIKDIKQIEVNGGVVVYETLINRR